MKKLKYTACLLWLLFIIPSILIPTYAHPGATDSNGGHFDHSTGEYHYHHGYPAHNHYDMDGDGVIDCPYNFEIKENHNGHNSVSNHDRYEGFKYDYYDKPIKVTPHRAETSKENTYKEAEKVKNVPIWLAISLIVMIVCLIFYTKYLHVQISTIKKTHEQENAKNAETIHSDMNFLLNGIEHTYGKNVIKELSGMPAGEDIDQNLYPMGKDSGKLPWGSKYTFFSHTETHSGYPHKFHRPGCRYANSCLAINAYQLKTKNVQRPCQICHPSLPDTSWVDNYFLYKKIFNKYGVELPNEITAKNSHP